MERRRLWICGSYSCEPIRLGKFGPNSMRNRKPLRKCGHIFGTQEYGFLSRSCERWLVVITIRLGGQCAVSNFASLDVVKLKSIFFNKSTCFLFELFCYHRRCMRELALEGDRNPSTGSSRNYRYHTSAQLNSKPWATVFLIALCLGQAAGEPILVFPLHMPLVGDRSTSAGLSG